MLQWLSLQYVPAVWPSDFRSRVPDRKRWLMTVSMEDLKIISHLSDKTNFSSFKLVRNVEITICQGLLFITLCSIIIAASLHTASAWLCISTLHWPLSQALQENRAMDRLYIITLWCLLGIRFACACPCCNVCVCLWQPPSISHHICFVTPHLSPLRAIIWLDKSHYGSATRLYVTAPQPRWQSQAAVISFN